MSAAETLPLRNLLDVAPDGFIVVDATGTISWANKTAHDLFGYCDVELLGRRIEDLIPERLQQLHTTHRGAYEENPYGRSMGLGLNLLARKKNGSEFPVEISLSPLHTRDGLLVTAVIRDVSERKQLEDERNILTLELETNRERNRIAMDLHDGIMQDIYAVALGLELSLDGSDHANAKVVEKSINQLHEVIRSIRSFIFDLKPREYSGSLPEALASLAEEFAQNSQISTAMNIESDEGHEPEAAVSMAVYHIAQETLSNIRKHAGASNVIVSLRFDEQSGSLEIRDDGLGFDPTIDPPQGHYGMRNMASRAKAINAELGFNTAPGKGTALLLRFPL